MKQVDEISIGELEEMAENMYGELVKAVVDVEKRTMVVDAGLHVDEEQWLLESGSRQNDLWGINLYPESFGDDDFVEFDSMINIRPAQGNRSRSVEDAHQGSDRRDRGGDSTWLATRLTASVGHSFPYSNRWATSAQKWAGR